jgi:hypothetical protein
MAPKRRKPEEFSRDPRWFLEGERRDQAVIALRDYFARYEGSWFDRLADHDHPYSITARDIVAVGTLDVDIPPQTAIWLLGHGTATVTTLLEMIPPSWTIWHQDADLTRQGAAWKLWNALDSNWWPCDHSDPGMGPTRISKLMAAKRPNLIPIHDSFMCTGVFAGKQPRNYWQPWQDLHRSPEGTTLRQHADSIRAEAGVGTHRAGLLRRQQHPHRRPAAALESAPGQVI